MAGKLQASICAFVVAALLLPSDGCLASGVVPSSRLFVNVGDFPLGARTNRTDYESIDPTARKLYIAKMGAGQLLVFDIDRNKLASELDGFPKVTGVLAVPEIHKVYASVPGGGLMSSLAVGLGMAGVSSGRGRVAVLDTQSFKEVARVPGGVFPDGIAYDPKDQRIFVSDELGSEVIVLDARTDKPIGRIETGGEVGNVRYDFTTEKIYVPVQSHDQLAVIDPEKDIILAHYATTGGKHPHGFIVAPRGEIGYVACDGNDRLLTIQLATGKMLANLPVVHDPDVLAVDAGASRLYVASESGALSTFDISNPESPVALGDVFVAEGAHSVAVDPVIHRLYFGLADVGGRSALRELDPKPR